MFIFPMALFPKTTIPIARDTNSPSKAAGGIDLQLLGIGRNGHVGFNEPTSSLASRTRLKALSRETVPKTIATLSPTSPKCRIAPSPCGIGTHSRIPAASCFSCLWPFQSRCRCQSHYEGLITSSASARQALQMHPDVTFIIDEDAAYSLTQRDYYRHVLEMTQIFTPERLS